MNPQQTQLVGRCGNSITILTCRQMQGATANSGSNADSKSTICELWSTPTIWSWQSWIANLAIVCSGLCWRWLITIGRCIRLAAYLDVNAAGSPACIVHTHIVTSWHVLTECSHNFARHKILKCRVYLKAQKSAFWYEYDVTCKIKHVSKDRIVECNRRRVKLMTALTQSRCTDMHFPILFTTASTPRLYGAKVPGQARSTKKDIKHYVVSCTSYTW